ncbi:TonB-dependent receptor [Acinetobacter apis]|uniref:Iron complex outermembrane recepter protein n=1 Tax=Acinetobacter apis TaxID=1229165 RepID=A0A217EDI7_9GAMM|nr:TonB-dependent receptor [Acinetobacter apis]SNQ28256.1 iron complex outermembrane recepter protein [Acinetobacter apis]
MKSSVSIKILNAVFFLVPATFSLNLYAGQNVFLIDSNLPAIKAEATRTGTTYLNTPASIYRADVPTQTRDIGVNLTEVVRGIPSLQLNNRQNYAQDLQLSMRGFGARSTFGVRGIRIYVDGIPATMPDGQGQTSNIDLYSLDHVEILTGPFSSLYGNSSGGVLLTHTKEGTGDDSVTLNYGAGKHDSNHSGVILQGGSGERGEPAYIISSSYFNTDGYRDNSGANKLMNNAKLTWNLEDGSKINWITNYVKSTADDPMGLTRAAWQTDPKQAVDASYKYNTRKELEQVQTGLTWLKRIDDQQTLYVMGYVGYRGVTQYQSIPNTTQRANESNTGGIISFDRAYYGMDLRWTGTDLLPSTDISLGVALDGMHDSRRGFENFLRTSANTAATDYDFGVQGNKRRDEDNTLWNIDPYLQASWQILPDWRLDTGMRFSNVHYKSEDQFIVGNNGDDSGDKVYQKFLPSAALSFQVLPSTLLYMSYAKGFETPTFTETTYRPDGQLGFNNNLLPSSSDNYEIGIKTNHQLGYFSAVAFESHTTNDIVSAGSTNGRATFQNADQTIRKGLEFSWTKKIWKQLIAQATYSYLDARFNADVQAVDTTNNIKKGAAIPGLAKNQAYASLAWQPDTGFRAGVDIRYMDKMYVDDQNSDAAPSYTITAFNVGYAYKVKEWSLNAYARLDNAFNRKYIGSVIVNDSNGRYFEPADRRYWGAGLSITKLF